MTSANIQGDTRMKIHAPWPLKLLILLAGLTCAVQAQRATEQFIPIGRSPGLSGKHTVMGKVEDLNTEQRCITVISADRKSYTIHCTDKTFFWIDRSDSEKPNIEGRLTQCTAGRLIEIKFRENDPDQPAEWVKVQVTAPE